MKIEELVPPLELCKKIPAGEFEDSAFIWINGIVHGRFFDIPNTIPPSIQKTIFPAPTLQDLIIALSDISYYSIKIYEVFNEWNVECLVEYGERFVSADSSYNPATAALKLWLKLKGVE